MGGGRLFRPAENLVVVEPVIPRGARFMRYAPWRLLFNVLVRRATMAALAAHDVLPSECLFWTYTPDAAWLLRDRWSSSVYWTGDEVTLPREERVLNAVEHVFAVSPPAYNRVAKLVGDRAVSMPMAVDGASFAAARRARALPSELAGLRRPIVGYGGAVGWRLDWQLLEEIARDLVGTLVLVGPAQDENDRKNVEELAKNQNVLWLGHRNADEAPAYVASFDVGLIPYTRSRFNHGSNPVKCYEYLAAGVPVVSTPIPALEPLRPHVSFGSSAAELVKAIREAAAESTAADVSRRQAAVARYSFNALVDRIDRRLAESRSAQ